MMRQLSIRIALGVILGGLLSCGPTAAIAAPVTFSFSGVVNHVDARLFPAFSAGQTFSGSYTFESTTPLTRPGNRYNGAITAFGANLGSYNAVLGAGNNFIAVTNHRGFDRYTLSAPLTPVPGAPGLALRFRLDLIDHSGNAFSSRALPTTPPSLSSFAANRWRLVFEDATGRARIRGMLTSLTAVPLPAAVILFGAGLVALAGFGAGNWRKRKNGLV